MKKLILAILAIGVSLIASAQYRPTFVYDDGTIPSGYFYQSSGFGGVYWSDGFGTAASGVVNYTPYTVTRQGSGTVISMNSKAPNVVIPGKQCNLSGGVNVSAGLFKPFLVVFGNKRDNSGVEDTTKPFTVDISSNPVLTISYQKPATPASDYYISGQIINSANGAPGAPYLYNLGNLPSTVTTPGASGSGNTAYFGTLGNLPPNITVAGSGSWSGNYVGNIYGLKSQGCCGTNVNDSPLRVTVQVVDSAGTRLEMISTRYTASSFTNGKLGWTMSTEAENRTIEIDLRNALALNYSSTLPGAPFSCTNAANCPSLKGGSVATAIASASGFRFDKVAKILIFFSGRCAGSAQDLGTFSTVGVCNYGPPNYTCYDNTVTITSFKLGSIPSTSITPSSIKLDSARFTSSTGTRIYYTDPAGASFDSIIVARSVISTGGWAVVGKTSPGSSPSGLSVNNAYDDGFLITTTVGTTLTFPGGSFTTTGEFFYKLGVAVQGLIIWGSTIAPTNGQIITAPGTGFNDDYISSSGFKISPNPSTGISTIEYTLNRAGLVSYKVMNSVGSEVVSSGATILAPGTYNESINLSGKTPGLYLVSIYIDGKPARTSKLVIE